MRRIVLLAVLHVAFYCFPQSSSAQWELGIESVAPTGDFTDVAGGGIGLYANFYRPANDYDDHFFYNLYVGALAYGGVELFGTEIQWNGYPVTLGATYYMKNIYDGGIFFKANAGLLFKIATIEFQGQEESENKRGTVVSIGGGWDFGAVNIAADYNLGSGDWTWFAIKASYRFGRSTWGRGG